jgi:hypothetical protein
VLGRLPGVGRLDALAGRAGAVARLTGVGEARFFATLFLPPPDGDPRPALDAFWELRPPRVLHRRVATVFELEQELRAWLVAAAGGDTRRSSWVRLVRAEEFADAHAVFAAWHPGEHLRERERLAVLATETPREELWPTPLIGSAELARAGIPRGPRWSELLRAAEDAQLDGELVSADQARAWLNARVRG